MAQCPYILPSRDEEFEFFYCQKEEGHRGNHETVYHHKDQQTRWKLKRDYYCPACGRSAEEGEQ